MKLEKICEYLNDIGILQLEDIDKFLKIYTQISHNHFKNSTDKLILALFSYITMISKNEQRLYNICKNIINCFSNNQILNRYRGLYMINNIFKARLISRYISFFSKLNFNRSKKNFYSSKKIKSKVKDKFKDESNNNEEIYNNSLGNNKINIYPIKTGKIVKKNSRKNLKNNQKEKEINNININNDNNIKENINFKTADNQEYDKECTFSPKINKNYKPKLNIILNEAINDESDYNTLINKSNDNINNNKSKRNNPFKNSANYANNNKINNELVKMIENVSKYSGNPNNSRYAPHKPLYRKQFNEMYTSNSYNELPIYSDPNFYEKNDLIDNYLDEEYDFYQNEKDHVKKVQDKIFQMKLQRQDEISKECTFTPIINEIPKYLYENKLDDNNMVDINRSYADNYNNHIYNINNDKISNRFNNSKSFSTKRKNKLNNEYIDDYYNIYPNKSKKKSHSKEAHSFSGSKGKSNEYSVYKNRKQELLNEIKKQYPFMPSITENKNFQIKTTFDERQKKFIEEKIKYRKDKEAEKLEKIEEMKRYYNKSKANIKELVKKLYDKEAEKIKEKIKKEKEEKSKKKKIIDWDKRIKEIKEKYPNEYNKNLKINIKSKKKEEINNIDDIKIKEKEKKEQTLTEKNKEKDINKKKKINSSKDKKKKKITSNPKDKKDKLMDKIKDEHVIGFKNNLTTNPIKSGLINTEKNETTKEDEKDKQDINMGSDNMRESSISGNFDNNSSLKSSIEFMKKYENEHLLDGIIKKGELKSNMLQKLLDKEQKK